MKPLVSGGWRMNDFTDESEFLSDDPQFIVGYDDMYSDPYDITDEQAEDAQ